MAEALKTALDGNPFWFALLTLMFAVWFPGHWVNQTRRAQLLLTTAVLLAVYGAGRVLTDAVLGEVDWTYPLFVGLVLLETWAASCYLRQLRQLRGRVEP